jgi:hypothetical protein
LRRSTPPPHGTGRSEGQVHDRPRDRHRYCPRGHTAPIYKPRRQRPSSTGERAARFARTDCEPCPLRQQFAPGGQRDIRFSRREDLRQAALEVSADPGERDPPKRTRPLIERLLRIIVHRFRRAQQPLPRRSKNHRSRPSGPRSSSTPEAWDSSCGGRWGSTNRTHADLPTNFLIAEFALADFRNLRRSRSGPTRRTLWDVLSEESSPETVSKRANGNCVSTVGAAPLSPATTACLWVCS